MENQKEELLIRLDTKIEYIMKGVDSLKSQEIKQWEKIDFCTTKLSDHNRSIIFLSRGFWSMLAIAGTITYFLWCIMKSVSNHG